MSRLVKTLCLVGAASAAVAIAAAPAVAAATYTVTAGSAASGTKVNFSGKTTGATPQVHFKDTTANTALTCDSGTAKGFTTTGSARPAAGIATVTGAALKLTNCTGPANLKLLVTGSGAWKLNATSYNATSGTTTFTITNIFAHVADPGGTLCAFDVSGTVQATYKNSTQLLAVKTAASTLALSNVVGCFAREQRRSRHLHRELQGQGDQRCVQPDPLRAELSYPNCAAGGQR